MPITHWNKVTGEIILNELRILYPSSVYPEKSGGYLRTFNIAKLISEKFNAVNIFATDETMEYSGVKDGIGIVQDIKYMGKLDKYYYYLEALFSAKYSLKCSNKVFNNSNKDNVLFLLESPYFFNLLKQKKIGRYILDEHNVNWELLKYPSFDLKTKLYNKLALKRDKLLEINALKNASHILVCSDRDKQIIIQELPETNDKITIIPNCIDFSEYKNYLKNNSIEKSKTKDGNCVLFMGLLSYSPNTDAVFSICNKIAPYFEKNIKFIIIGKDPPKIRKPDNVEFLGYVDDLKKYILNSDICIAPLRYGSGTRFKILEYMAMGKPVISTSKGAEGIDYTQDENIIIEDDIDAFAKRIKELLNDNERRNWMGRKAINLIKHKYDWKIYKKVLFDIFE